jgi:hypothetical protein
VGAALRRQRELRLPISEEEPDPVPGLDVRAPAQAPA